jgi:magnesium transporter
VRFAWETVAEKLHRLTRVRDRRAIRRELADAEPVDIAEAILRAKPEDGARILHALEPARAGEVLVELPPSTARSLAVKLPPDAIARYLDVLEMDDAAALLDELPEEARGPLLQAIPEQDAAEIRRLLAYPRESAGRLMTENFPRVQMHWTVDDTLRMLRDAKGKYGATVYLYVVDDGGRLLGVCPLRRLVEEEPDVRVEAIMNTDVVTCPPDMDQEDVAMLFMRYDFLSLPVVDVDGRLLGIVMLDDVLDVVEEEETEDIYRLAAVQSGREPYLALGIWSLAKRRFGWLLILFIAGTLTGHVLLHYQSELDQLLGLAVFIPLLMGTGGNAGAQAATMVTRAIALDELVFRDLWRVLGREFATGLLVGLLLGAVGYLRAATWHLTIGLPLVVMLSQTAIVIWATTIGAGVPLLAHRLGWDPALMSSPALSTLVDATGLVIYFEIAHLLLPL